MSIISSPIRQVLMPHVRPIIGASVRLGIFNPLRLFLAGEQGAWYDPSDLTTLFQDSAGTIPVSAHGQPVGLMLDKSRGLVRGEELVTNGDFSQGSTGWTVIGTGWSIADGMIRSSGATDYGPYSTNTDVIAGRFYEVRFTISVSNGAAYVRCGNTQSGAYTASGTYSLRVAATTTGVTTFQVRASAGGFTGSFDSISVRELPGNHASQPTAASRPLYKTPPSQIDYDAIDDVLNATFPVDLGSSVTIARAIPGVGAQILTGQTVGTTYADNVDHAGLIIVNRALTAAETAQVTKYLNRKAGV